MAPTTHTAKVMTTGSRKLKRSSREVGLGVDVDELCLFVHNGELTTNNGRFHPQGTNPSI